MYGTTYTQEGWERRWTILANVAHFLSRNTRDDEGGKEERGVMAFARSGRSLSLSLSLYLPLKNLWKILSVFKLNDTVRLHPLSLFLYLSFRLNANTFWR